MKHSAGGGHCGEHGGGKKCTEENCSNNALYGGIPDKCYSHGGGKRCRMEGCNKAPRIPTELCVSHGGGVKCKTQGCLSLARAAGMCGVHGGRKRCRDPLCTKFAKANNVCKMHASNKQCNVANCAHLSVKGSSLCEKHAKAKKKPTGTSVKPNLTQNELLPNLAVDASDNFQVENVALSDDDVSEDDRIIQQLQEQLKAVERRKAMKLKRRHEVIGTHEDKRRKPFAEESGEWQLGS